VKSGAPEQPEAVDVLALIDHFVAGGAETLLARFAASAPRAGIKLSIACLQELNGNPAAKPLYELGNPPVNLNITGRPRFGALRAVRRHIERHRPQVVHTHLGTSDVLGGVAARSLGIPVVCTIHSTQWARRELTRRRLVSFCANRVIAVSESARREYLRLGLAREDQIVTIHNGIDVVARPDAGAGVRRELGLDPRDLVIGMVSALRPEKGHDVAIAVLRRLRPTFPQLRLLVVGEGDLAPEIRRSSGDLGGAVVMAGLRTDVMDVLDAVDVCLQPSRADAFPTSLIEAMAASVPVLATAVGGIPEIVTNGSTGVLVPSPPNVETIAEALAALLGDCGRRRQLAEGGRRRYEERFTATPWIQRTRELYDAVLGQPNRQRSRALRIGRHGGMTEETSRS
jgi:glycosyltransferase involved in cell wall biosynthesis